jgi:stalled ribosome rescue protein Dom34
MWNANERAPMPKHVAIWIDHKEARIFAIHPDSIDESMLAAPKHIHNKPPKGSDPGDEPTDDVKRFFREVKRDLEGTKEILVVGPSTAKLEFLRYVRKHDHDIESRIVGIESVEHHADPQLVAYARSYFARDERMKKAS